MVKNSIIIFMKHEYHISSTAESGCRTYSSVHL